MASTIRQLSTSTSELVTACYVIGDLACALDVVVFNALEAGATRIRVECPEPFTSFVVCNNGSGFSSKSWSFIGKEPASTKRSEHNRGFGLFYLSKLASLYFTSLGSQAGSLMYKALQIGGNQIRQEESMKKSLEHGFSTKVEVKDLFSTCFVRSAHILANPALQQSLALDFLRNTAATHPITHFDFYIGNLPHITLPATTSFQRLAQLFDTSFSPAHDWLPLSYSSSELSLDGWINAPTGLEQPDKRNNARMIAFNGRMVDSPQIRSTVESVWKAKLGEITSWRSTKYQRPIFYIEISSSTELFEVFHGIDPSCLLLHCNDWSSTRSIIEAHMNDILSRELPKATPTSTPSSLKCSSPSVENPSLVTKKTLVSDTRHSDIAERDESLESIWKKSQQFRLEWKSSRRHEIPHSRAPLTKIGDTSVLKDLRSVGQWDAKFLLALTRHGDLLAFDQHAVHERIRFEALLRSLHAHSPTAIRQESTTPSVWHGITLSHYISLKQGQETINKRFWKFELSDATSESHHLRNCPFAVKLITQPVVCDEPLGLEHLIEYAQELSGDFGAIAMPSSFVLIIKSRACRGAIMFGDELSLEQQEGLLLQLQECRFPFSCAHGRTNATVIMDRI